MWLDFLQTFSLLNCQCLQAVLLFWNPLPFEHYTFSLHKHQTWSTQKFWAVHQNQYLKKKYTSIKSFLTFSVSFDCFKPSPKSLFTVYNAHQPRERKLFSLSFSSFFSSFRSKDLLMLGLSMPILTKKSVFTLKFSINLKKWSSKWK